jgi:hypothetical protein
MKYELAKEPLKGPGRTARGSHSNSECNTRNLQADEAGITGHDWRLAFQGQGLSITTDTKILLDGLSKGSS